MKRARDLCRWIAESFSPRFDRAPGPCSVVAVVLIVVPGLSGDDSRSPGHWPQFHGPNRDNISTEKGLLKKWPEGGPKLLWKFSECGRGYSGISTVDGMIFTAGDFADKECVIALDLNGKVLWKVGNGESWKGPMPGSRTTPTYADGVLYHMGPTGRLAAYAARSGQEQWSVDLRREFGAEFGRWGMSENVVIDGDAVLCVPGGQRGRIVALDRRTGRRIWANTRIDEAAAYSSPVVVTHNETRQFITLMQKSVVSVDVSTGKLLWSHHHDTKYDQNVTGPVFQGGHVYVTSGHGTGGRLLKIDSSGDRVRQVWAAKDLDNCHGGVILLDGRLYGSGCRLFRKGLVCVDFLTGKTLYNDPTIGKVSITYADGLLYCLSDRGRMSLVALDRDRFTVVSHFDVPREDRQVVLSHPVVCGGRLFIRHDHDLFAYDISS